MANPLTRTPASIAPRALTEMNPVTRGTTTASAPGTIISFSEASVEMATHRAESGIAPSLPSRRPGMSRNCRRTSSIILLAARPTASIVRAANRNGSPAPRKSPMNASTSPMLRSSDPPAAAIAYSKLLKSASAVSAAEPTAKPFAIAAVVLPRLSRASVTFRTDGSR